MSAADWDESKNDPLYRFTKALLGDGEQFAVRIAPDGTALVWISKKTMKNFVDRGASASCFWALSKDAVDAFKGPIDG